MTTGENMMHTKAEREALLAAQPERQRTSHQGRKLRYEGTRFPCPHCKASSEIRTGRMVSATMRESIYQCTNVECGHTFIVDAEVSRTLSPSLGHSPCCFKATSTSRNVSMPDILPFSMTTREPTSNSAMASIAEARDCSGVVV